MHRPEACLFDLDGVLLDTENLHSQAWSKTAEIYGKKLSRKQLILLKGRRRLDCAEQIIKWIDRPIKLEDFVIRHKPISIELITKAKAMSGAKELVNWCFYNNLPMALVTSSTSSSVDFKSRSHSWLKLIKTRVNGDDIALIKGKPAPDPFLLAANKLGVDPKNCWALEDSNSGIQSAIEAGCIVWALKNPTVDISHGKKKKSIFHIQHLNEVLIQLGGG